MTDGRADTCQLLGVEDVVVEGFRVNRRGRSQFMRPTVRTLRDRQKGCVQRIQRLGDIRDLRWPRE